MERDLKRYFDTLELAPDATMDDLNQAYRDLVNIWHPDRFTHNPRLKKKAEEKLTEVNQAYEALKSSLYSESGRGTNARAGSHGTAHQKPGTKREEKEGNYPDEVKTEIEAVGESGTTSVLRLWFFLSTRLRRLVGEQVQAFKEGAYTDQQGANRGQGSGVDRGRGEGMGRRTPGQRPGRGRRRAGGGSRGGRGPRSS